ncbi:unnamed protein product [Brachionus calyciflorus]|uniref:Non-specific serine/threonine protein kinase n=1 Tax=Brachionus calyciflorus TaxID=104777 RepID=A0A813M2C8_9BILA|nr:unnamed protein product [Brachionus calyciflorus]
MQIRTEPFRDFYDIYEDLGSGQFAIVRRCREASTNLEYAAKFVAKRRPNSSSRKGLFREKILQEIEILSELKHNNIISLHEVFETDHEIILVLELVKGGELFEFISEKDHLSESDAAKFITQILEGVSHFHARNIVHLDLKPENVMLLDRDDCLIKIIDFGISRKLKPGEKVMETYGTPEFVAPEIIQYQPISTATDMWSIGVITYILLSGASPFLGDSKQETFANITNIDYSFDDEYFGHTSDLAKDFISRLFVKDVRKRATVKDCLEHPWIKPRRQTDEDLRRQAQINIEQFKSYQARRRWKVQMKCESRTVRTVTTKYRDSEGNIKSKRRAELSGKSVLYEGEYSETDSEPESDRPREPLVKNLGVFESGQLDDIRLGIDSIKIGNHRASSDDPAMSQRQKLLNIPNIELKPIKVTEFNESLDGDSDENESVNDSSKLQAKIDSHLGLNKTAEVIDNNQNIISDETKVDEKSDFRIIDSHDEKTGLAVRTSIENKMKTNENVKVCKADNVDVQETDDAIVKKITTKTKTTKKVVKTTTTTTTKKTIGSGNNINRVSLGQNLYKNENDFVLTALFYAAETGDYFNLKQLLQIAPIDVNKTNQNRETAVHIAAQNGQLEILKLLNQFKTNLHARDINEENAIHFCSRCNNVENSKPIISYLVKNGVSLNSQNKNGETPLHIASRYGCIELVRILCEYGANLDIQDDQLETALHVACWNGFPEIVKCLCHYGCDVNLKNKEGETGLIVACARGCIESVKTLTEHKADLNCRDNRRNTALHWAVKRHFNMIALLLINAECNMDLLDSNGESALHIACRQNLLPVVQTMCSLGCRVDIKNKNEMTPLHTATERNDIDAVRCLCLAGLDLSIKNRDGYTAEQLAINLKHSNIANLLNSLRRDENRGMFIEQLDATNDVLRRIKVKVFGSSNVGKTTLIDSMNCSYLNSFFRKTRLSTNTKPQKNYGRKRNVLEKINTHQIHTDALDINDLVIEPEKINKTNILDNYDLVNQNYTKGIQTTQCTFSGSHFTLWEYSGYEPYKNFYDQFIDQSCYIHLILYKINETQDDCFKECVKWLEYLRSRLVKNTLNQVNLSLNSLDHNATSISNLDDNFSHSIKVVFVGTHSDLEPDSSEKANNLKNLLENYYTNDDIFDLSERHYLLDSRAAWESEIKLLIQKLVKLKQSVLEFLPRCTMLLNRTLFHIQNWRKLLQPQQGLVTPPSTPTINSKNFSFFPPVSNTYPVMTWKYFIDQIRDLINPLASDEHLIRLKSQLELMGEIVCIKKSEQDLLVCFQPEWLFKILGRLFTHERFYQSINLNGIFKLNDLSEIFQDLCPNINLIKDILISFDLCTEFEDSQNGDLLYEFSTLNFLSEPLPLAFQNVKNFPHQNAQFVSHGFHIKQSLYHLNRPLQKLSMNSSMTQSIMMLPIVKPSQLSNIFFKLQIFLRHLTCNFEDNVKKLRVDTPTRVHKPLARAQSKLDTLLDSPESNSSYPNTANSTMNILKFNKNFKFLPPVNHGTLIDLDLYQTRYCSRLTRKSCFIEALLSLDHLNGDYIELRACAPDTHREELFYFVQDLYTVIEHVILDICPNINLEKNYLLFKPVRLPVKTGIIGHELIYSNKDLILLQMENKVKFESVFLDLVCCGSELIRKNLSLGMDLSVNKMAIYTRKMLCKMLDKVDPMGRDWSILAFLLGLQDYLKNLDEENTPISTTPTNSISSSTCLKSSKCEFVLNEWFKLRPEQANVKNLLSKIRDLGRLDVYEMVLNTVNLFNANTQRDSGIQNSNQTLASIK